MSHAVIKADVVLVLAQVIDLYISLYRERLGPAQTADDGGQVGLSCGDSGQPSLAAGQVCGNAGVTTCPRLVCGVSHRALMRPELPSPS